MRGFRSVYVLAVALVVLAAAPGSAAAADANTVETPTNATAIAANGATTIDYDTDGAADEIAYIDPTGFEVKVYEPSSDQIYSLFANDAAGSIAAGDATGNGNDDVLYRDGNDNLHLLQPQQNSDFEASIKITGDSLAVGANDKAWVGNKSTGNLSRINWSAQTQAGLATDTGVPIDDGTVISVNTAAGAGNDRVAFTGADGELKVYNDTTDTVTTSGVTGTNASFGDVDGDTETEIVFTDDGDELRVWNYTQPGSTPTTTGVAARAVSAGDVTGDGTDEAAITTPAGEHRVVDVVSGAVTDTGIGGGGAVATGDVTDDGEAEVIAVAGFELQYYDDSATAPSITDVVPSPGTAVDKSVRLAAQINDSDFASDIDEGILVEFLVDGSVVGSETLTANGTADTTTSLQQTGERSYAVRATDRATARQTPSQSLFVPANLTVRNETNASEIIDGQPVDVRLIGDDGTVREVTTTNGTVSLFGFSQQGYDIEVSTANYTDRQTRIRTIATPQDVLLVPSDETTVTSRFQLEDATGTFGAQSTVFVEAPVNRSGTISYETVAADQVGVEGATLTLRKDTRYELRVSNGQTTAQLAQYRAEANETVVLEPSAPAVTAPNGSAVGYEIAYDAGAERINIEFVDPRGATDPLTVSVISRDGSVLKPEQQYANTSQLSLAVPTNGKLNQTHFVIIEGERANGDAVSIREPVGPQQADITARLPDQVWVQIISAVAILLVGGVFSQLNRGVGAVITSLFGGVLWFFGFMSGLASGAAIALAIGISALNLFAPD